MEEKIYDLTSPQKNIWLTEQFHTGTNIENICGILTIQEKVNFKALENALNYFVENNDSMRININLYNDIPKQVIKKYEYFNIEIKELKSEKEKLELQNEMAKTCFNMLNTNLYKLIIFKMPDGTGGYSANLHHIISDAWTMGLLIKQVLTYYNMFSNNEKIEKEKYSYEDYINSEKEYFNSSTFIKDKEYWKKYFENLPEIVSLKENKQPSTKAIRKEIIINEKSTNKINDFCKRNKISQYVFLLSVFSIYFRDKLNTKKYIIGNPILNRANYKEKNTTGLFMSVNPFKIEINDDNNFLEYCKTIESSQKEMYRHIKYPFENILKDINEIHNVNTSLFDIVFSYQNVRIKEEDVQTKYDSTWLVNDNQLETLIIHIKDLQNTGSLYIDYDYLIDIFDDASIEKLHNSILEIINQTLDNETIKISKIDIVSKNEKEYLLNELNKTNMEYDKTLNIVKMFEKQVAEIPENIAIVSEKKQISYKELNNKINFLANNLKETGIKSGDVISLMTNRNENIIIIIFAILKLGAIYMPIDPEYPEDRINFMLENSGAKIIITTDKLKEKISKVKILILEKIFENYKREEEIENLNLDIKPNQLAYIMYTSGSTGNPKAVSIMHYNVISFVKSMQKKLNYRNDIKNSVLSVTTMCFDIFVFEVFPTLLSGLTLVIANEYESKSPELMNELIINENINKILTTPSRVQLLFLDNDNLKCLEGLEEIILGGEPFPKDLLHKLQKVTNSKIYNLYGPTETTVYSAFKELTKSKEITIGTPIENTQIYILNENNKLVSYGEIGEICIGGAGVGLGYYKNENLTNTVFIQNPYKYDDIIYKTGDLGKWQNEELICLGRKDFQIKIRGYRIELDDIVNNILTYDNILKAVVIDKDTAEGKKYLCAYIVSNEKINMELLKKYLIKKLPNYMVPSHYMQIDEIPLNSNHKINRKMLPEIATKINENIEYVEPKTENQKILCEIISEELKLKKIGITNDIFDFNIDSLNIISIQTKLLKHNVKIKIQDFYEHHTIEKILENTNKESEKNYDINLSNINNTFLKNDGNVELVNNNYKGLLLIGATGFLGMHLLKEFLEKNDVLIYCLVRNKEKTKAIDRIKKLYNFYFDEELVSKNVIVIEADVLEENLGLSLINYAEVCQNIDLVINAAANVKYYGDSEKSKEININLTRKLADFCIKENKFLAQISTTGVSGNLLVENFKEKVNFSENDFYIKQEYKENIYVNSKFESEKVIYEKISEGLNATIIRVGNLTGRYKDGIFQKNINDNAFYNFIKMIISSETLPNDILNQEMEFTPIDLCSLAIYKLLTFTNINRKVLHIFNNKTLLLKDFITYLNQLNYVVNIVEAHRYNDSQKKHDASSTLISSFNKNLDFSSNIILKNSFTNKYLEKVDFEWKNINLDYIEKIVKYLEKINFIGDNIC